jgi:hypothetical protein
MLIISRCHIKFNYPMFLFSFYYLIAHLFNFVFARVQYCIFMLGHTEFSFSFNLLFHNIGNTYIMSKLYTFDIYLIISFLSHIKRSFYNIDKLDVCSGGGSFISNVTSTYFNFSFNTTLIIVRTFKVWCYNWLITFVHNLLSFFCLYPSSRLSSSRALYVYQLYKIYGIKYILMKQHYSSFDGKYIHNKTW